VSHPAPRLPEFQSLSLQSIELSNLGSTDLSLPTRKLPRMAYSSPRGRERSHERDYEGRIWTLPRRRGGASVRTSRSGVPRFEPLPIGVGVGIGIGIEPKRPSIPMPIPIPTAKPWVDGVSRHPCLGAVSGCARLQGLALSPARLRGLALSPARLRGRERSPPQSSLVTRSQSRLAPPHTSLSSQT
jgi:hypothetical protein